MAIRLTAWRHDGMARLCMRQSVRPACWECIVLVWQAAWIQHQDVVGRGDMDPLVLACQRGMGVHLHGSQELVKDALQRHSRGALLLLLLLLLLLPYVWADQQGQAPVQTAIVGLCGLISMRTYPWTLSYTEQCRRLSVHVLPGVVSAAPKHAVLAASRP